MIAAVSLIHRLLVAKCAVCGVRSYRILCSRCQESPALRSRTASGLPLVALGAFEGELRDRISALKYRDETIWAEVLAESLASKYPDEFGDASLVPLPLHPLRLVDRGYNQSALIARRLSKKLKRPMKLDLVERRAFTRSQVGLDGEQRAENVAGAFGVSLPGEDSDAPIVLVDDVATTGSSLDACAVELRRAGFEVRGALCCALSGGALRSVRGSSEAMSGTRRALSGTRRT